MWEFDKTFNSEIGFGAECIGKFDVFLFPGDFFLEGIHQQGFFLGIEQEGVVLQLLRGGHWYGHQYTLPLLMRSE